MLTMLTSWTHPADVLDTHADVLGTHPEQVSVTWVQPRVISREALGKRVARLEEWMDKVMSIYDNRWTGLQNRWAGLQNRWTGAKAWCGSALRDLARGAWKARRPPRGVDGQGQYFHP